MDERRFDLHNVIRRCWGLRGKCVIKPFQRPFDWDFKDAAVHILSAEPSFHPEPSINGEPVRIILGELVQRAPGAYLITLEGGAGFHQPTPAGAEGRCMEKVHKLKLPTNCPERNPAKKMGDEVKDAL